MPCCNLLRILPAAWFPRSAWEPKDCDALRRATQSVANVRSHAERGNEVRMFMALLAAGVVLAAAHSLRADGPNAAIDPRVLGLEAQRVAVIDKVSPSVVAIFSPGGQGG